jgi:transposase
MLDRTIRSKLRSIAVERHRDGEPVGAIAASLGVSGSAIYAWIRRGTSQAQYPGRTDAAAATLALASDAGVVDKTQLYNMLDSASPRYYGFDTDLWSRFVVCALLELKFGISLDPVQTETLLQTLGFPVDACIGADIHAELAAAKTWSRPKYLVERKRARQLRADLVFWHEWAPGGTGTAVPAADRQTRHIAWAVNGTGGFWYCTRRAGGSRRSSVSNLQSMMRDRLNPCHIIASDLRLLSDPELKAFAGSTGNRLVLCQPPATIPRSSARVRSDNPPLQESR